MDISIVIPLFNEEESLPELTRWIDEVMARNGFSYEVVFVDDGSTDSSWKVIEELTHEYKTIRGIKLRRNYGKSGALFTGFKAANGDVVVTMDADLQDSPEEVPEMYRMIKEENLDLVSGWKKKRFDPRLSKNLPSKLFNSAVRIATGIKLNDFNCGLKAYKKQVIKTIEVYGEMHRLIPVLAKMNGFKNIGEKVVQHQKRKYGVTKFGLERFINGFLDLLSILFMAKFGKRPMHFFGSIGTLMFIIGFCAAIYLGIDKLHAVFTHVKAPLITSSPYFYLALTTMIIGTQLFLAGFLGELISRNSSERNEYKIDKEI